MSVEELSRVDHIKEVELGQHWEWSFHEGFICWGASLYSQLLKLLSSRPRIENKKYLTEARTDWNMSHLYLRTTALMISDKRETKKQTVRLLMRVNIVLIIFTLPLPVSRHN